MEYAGYGWKKVLEVKNAFECTQTGKENGRNEESG